MYQTEDTCWIQTTFSKCAHPSLWNQASTQAVLSVAAMYDYYGNILHYWPSPDPVNTAGAGREGTQSTPPWSPLPGARVLSREGENPCLKLLRKTDPTPGLPIPCQVLPNCYTAKAQPSCRGHFIPQGLTPAHLQRVPSQASPPKARPETKLASGQKLMSKCLYSVFWMYLLVTFSFLSAKQFINKIFVLILEFTVVVFNSMYKMAKKKKKREFPINAKKNTKKQQSTAKRKIKHREREQGNWQKGRRKKETKELQQS